MKRLSLLLTVCHFNFATSNAQEVPPTRVQKASQEINTMMQKKATEKGMKEMKPYTMEVISSAEIPLGYYLEKFDGINADCVLMSKIKSEPFAVYGAIGEKYRNEGRAASILGYPQKDEAKIKDGAYQFFEKGGIYWSPKTNAHIVRGKILQRYMNEKYAEGFLGFPVDDLKITPDKQGAYCYFEGGCIYNNNKYGSFIIAGDILSMWAKDNYERGFLGYPIAEAKGFKLGAKSNEITTWSQEFEAGMLVANVGSGSKFMVPGLNSKNGRDGAGIYAKYRAMGGAGSYIGFPVENAIHGQGVWLQQFSSGYIYRKDNDAIGYVIRKGPIWNEFAKRNWEKGCGYVVDEEVTKGNITYQVFSKGTIYFMADVNQTIWKEGDNGKWYLDKKDNKGAVSQF